MLWKFLKQHHWGKELPRYPDVLVPTGCKSDYAFYLVFEAPEFGNKTFTPEALQDSVDPELFHVLMTGDFSGCFGYINMSNVTPTGFSYMWGDNLIELLKEFDQSYSYVSEANYYVVTMVDFKTKSEALQFKLKFL